MPAVSASQSRAADSTSVSSTACRSKVERLITLSTSAVAVCCCSDSRSSLSRRVFSMAMTAWLGEILHQLDLLVGERPDLLAVDDDGADQLVLLEHRHAEHGCARRRARPHRHWITLRDRLSVGISATCSHLRDRQRRPQRLAAETDHAPPRAMSASSGGAPCSAARLEGARRR